MEEQRVNLDKAEAETLALHDREAMDTVLIWQDGLNTLLRGMDPLKGHVNVPPEQMAMVAILTRAWNSVYCALDLARRGYYPQALNLLRLPREDSVAYWYLRSFPHEYEKFMDPQQETPRFDTMMTAIEKKHFGGQRETVMRGMIKPLHRFAHVDSRNLTMGIRQVDRTMYFVLGPQESAPLFRKCAATAALAIISLLEALDNLRQLRACDPLDWRAFSERYVNWEKQRQTLETQESTT